MMRIIFLVMLQLAWSYSASQGAGAYSYADSSGNRYGGTYGLKDGKIVRNGNEYQVPFADTVYQGEDFGSSYFSNLENLLQEVFRSNIENQRLAFNAARKAFDLTSNQAAGFYPNPNVASRFAPLNFPGAGFPFGGIPMPVIPTFGNSAFASAAAGPGFQHQVASIYPANPNIPNVDETVNHYADTSVPTRGGYYSVSSKSYSSSSNVNGKEVKNRGAETVVNDNGKVTHYKVQN